MRIFNALIWKTLIAIDQLVNTCLGWLFNWILGVNPGPFGYPDETISSVLGKLRYANRLGKFVWLYRFLNWLEPDHCESAIEWSEGWTVYEIERALK